MNLSCSKLAGSNSATEKADNEFYSTNPKALEMLLDTYKFTGNTFLEPCVGDGNLAKVIKQRYGKEMDCIDIVDRGYPNTIVADFLTYITDKKYDAIITNPPFSLAQRFVEKGLSLLKENGQMVMFLKIQFLESAKRKKFLNTYPPKCIYAFSDRMATWKNGEKLDPKGNKWQTTFFHAWFIWENGSITEPVVRLL